ncbi:HAD family phosphatase [Conexibacter sp. SYSU D00693]|uniref:HAD family hydrolase n=1 Tax=Conexibacter sp. SYSU D00693 TaxID=2812560 RepID=UPI00196A3FA3|nr:HAD family phosphatase [Conexibacter sp. SYSU D00693]
MITTVVCDFGGVLTTPLVDAFEDIQDHLGVEPGELNGAMVELEARTGYHPLHELECGRMSEKTFLEVLSHEVGQPLEEFTERYWAALGTNDAMVDLLARLRDQGYRMALLTNNVREWEPRWRAMLPVDELFEEVVDSAFVGMRKPDPQIYLLTCERLGVEPGACVFIDDFPHNCDAARDVGMRAVQFQTTEQAIAEVEELLAAEGAPQGAPAD